MTTYVHPEIQPGQRTVRATSTQALTQQLDQTARLFGWCTPQGVAR